MSESQVNAYFVDEDLIHNGFSSKNAKVLERVLSDPNGLIERFSPRFSNKSLADAVRELVNGEEQKGYPFHNSFALWIIVDATAERRPHKSHIPTPFIDLYEFNELLEDQGIYAQLLEVFRSLNYEVHNKFPYRLIEWGDLPGFAYVSVADLEGLKNEIVNLELAFENEKEWTLGIEEPDDVLQILAWLQQALKTKQDILLVMEGDL